MRKKTRTHLETIADFLQSLSEEVGAIAADARTDFDSKSERWQESDKGQEVSGEIDEFDSAAQDLSEVASRLQSILEIEVV